MNPVTRPAHTIAGGVVALPSGFRAGVGAAGLREEANDVTVLVSDRECRSSAVFTRSLFAGPSVLVSRENAASGRARGVVVVAGNANVATGAEGLADATEILERAAHAAGVESGAFLIASTGVIGRRYPMDLLRTLLDGLGPDDFTADAGAVAAAMMTTDTRPKTCVREVPTADGRTARVVGVAKGVGMIEPDMATMIALVLTDAEVPRLDEIFREVIADTFNALSVDTDTSTSDTAIALANGAAGPVDENDVRGALGEVCLDLTRQLARDGEGATKLLTVRVGGARDRRQATVVAKAILNSPLVKTAVHGADPNWGRVAMAIGKCSDETDIDPAQVRIVFGDLECYPAFPGEAELARLTEIMRAEEVAIDVDLGVRSGPTAGERTVYGCDLSREYVAINADYTT